MSKGKSIQHVQKPPEIKVGLFCDILISHEAQIAAENGVLFPVQQAYRVVPIAMSRQWTTVLMDLLP